jgi:hypothetical protein
MSAMVIGIFQGKYREKKGVARIKFHERTTKSVLSKCRIIVEPVVGGNIYDRKMYKDNLLEQENQKEFVATNWLASQFDGR